MSNVAGIVGLGIMGGAIARNLAKAGWSVTGYDLDGTARSEAEKAGVTLAGSALAVAEAAPTIILSLPSPAAARAVAAEVAEAKQKRVVVETSTLALHDKEAIRDTLESAGHTPLDCPLSGTGAQAATGDLVVYASGDSAAIAASMELFAGFSRQAHDVGTYGNGSRMKFIANLLVAIHNVASAEAMLLAEKAGLDLKQVVKLISAGAAQSRMFEMRAPLMAENRYEPATMRMSTWQKDMAVIGEFAAALGVPTPTFSATIPVYAAALGLGLGDQDTAASLKVLEAMAGVERND